MFQWNERRALLGGKTITTFHTKHLNLNIYYGKRTNVSTDFKPGMCLLAILFNRKENISSFFSGMCLLGSTQHQQEQMMLRGSKAEKTFLRLRQAFPFFVLPALNTKKLENCKKTEFARWLP